MICVAFIAAGRDACKTFCFILNLTLIGLSKIVADGFLFVFAFCLFVFCCCFFFVVVFFFFFVVVLFCFVFCFVLVFF